MWRLFLPNPDATEAFGRALAPHLAAGDTLLLSGPIGAGKSVLARALLRARLAPDGDGRGEEMPSPSYTLVQPYEDGHARLLHVDLYRLADASELVELGLLDDLPGAIALIEWGERLGAMAPPRWVSLALCPVEGTGAGAEARSLDLTRAGDWPWLDAVAEAAGARRLAGAPV